MSDHAAFLQAILDNPDDDNPRLVYATWLDEQGDPVGQFIALQCRIAALEVGCLCGVCAQRRGPGLRTNGPCAVDQARDVLQDGSSRQAFLRHRERELWGAWPSEDDIRSRFQAAMPTAFGECGILPESIAAAGGMSFPCSLVRRGFVDRIACTLADWLAHGPAIVAACPLLRTVRITDRDPDHDGWVAWFSRDELLRDTSTLPPELFVMLPAVAAYGDEINLFYASYESTKTAHADLSAACLAMARMSNLMLAKMSQRWDELGHECATAWRRLKSTTPPAVPPGT